MGKLKKPKKYSQKFVSPLGQSYSNTDLGNSNENDLKPIEAIRDQLQSCIIEEKINGLQAISVIAACHDRVSAIFNYDIVKIISPFMCDNDEALQNAATGALRSLSGISTEMCEFLISQDVLSPLLKMLCEFSDSKWIPKFDAMMYNQMDLRTDTFFNGITVLWMLCECDPSIVETLNQTTLLDKIVICLDHNVYGFDIAISVSQLLLIATENNPKSWVKMKDNSAILLKVLQLNGDSSHIYLRTLCAGITSNIISLFEENSTLVINALSNTLEHDSVKVLSANSSDLLDSKEKTDIGIEIDDHDIMDVSIEESEGDASKRRRFEELPTDKDIALKKVEYLIEAQRLAVETITNICCLDGYDADSDDIIDDNDAHEDEGDNDNGTLDSEIKQLFLNNCIIEKLWKLVGIIPENNFSKIKNEENSVLFRKQEQLQRETFLCLQNLSNIFSCEELGGSPFLYKVWVELGQSMFQEKDFETTEATTALMRSILEHLKHRKDLFLQITENDLQLILNVVINCSVSEVRANWLRMLGTLGNMLPNQQVVLIINLIIDLCQKETDLWAMTEALDSLMDLFSSDDRNQLIAPLNLVEKFRNILQLYKLKAKQMKTEGRIRKVAIRTVLKNFCRFITYIETCN